ncbi:MAG: hypothetical protein ACI8RZ_000935 [Myxococcota bacterium]|jgi:hypothetical protein
MLTLRDDTGRRLLTEAALCEEIRSGAVGPGVEVRREGMGFALIEAVTPFGALLDAPEARLARRLKAPPLPGLALGWLVLIGIGLLAGERGVDATDLLEWVGPLAWARAMGAATFGAVLVTLPVVGILALNERAFGAAAVAWPALGVVVPVSLWVSLGLERGLSLSVLTAAGILGSCLGICERNRACLPDYRRESYGRWQYFALLPMLLLLIDDVDALIAVWMLVVLVGAFVLAFLWRPALLGGDRIGIFSAASILMLPMLVGLAARAEPDLMRSGRTVTLHPSGVTLWVPTRHTPGENSHDWSRTWRFVHTDLTLSLVENPEGGFEARFSDAVEKYPGLAAVMIASATFDDPYDVATVCSDGEVIDCARSRYLAGDLDEAHRIAIRVDQWRSDRSEVWLLLLDIWAIRPELRPEDADALLLGWLEVVAGRYYGLESELFPVLMAAMDAEPCALITARIDTLPEEDGAYTLYNHKCREVELARLSEAGCEATVARLDEITSAHPLHAFLDEQRWMRCRLDGERRDGSLINHLGSTPPAPVTP